MAADQNDPEGLRLLGDIHRYGLGRAVDTDTARQYYQRSADLGNLVAYQKLLSDSALNNQQNYKLTKEIALQRQEAERLYKLAFAAHYGLKRHKIMLKHWSYTFSLQNEDTVNHKPILA